MQNLPRRTGESPAQFARALPLPGKPKWAWWIGMHLIVNGMIAKDPSSVASKRDDLSALYTSSEAYRLRDMVMA